MKNKFEFGDKVRHIILGIEGIVMAYTFYSTGCVHYGVQRQELDEDGNARNWLWYDENRLKLCDKKVVDLTNYVTKTSGPAPNAPQG